jgi:S1-C subfamily serine protease
VGLTVLRENREQNFRFSLAELPDRPRQEGDEGSGEEAPTSGKFGLTLQPLTAETASRLGLAANDQGIVVMKVDPAGSASDAGIRQGDLIQEVNRRPIRSQADFNAAVQLSGARPALVLIKRRDAVTYVTLKPGS